MNYITQNSITQEELENMPVSDVLDIFAKNKKICCYLDGNANYDQGIIYRMTPELNGIRNRRFLSGKKNFEGQAVNNALDSMDGATCTQDIRRNPNEQKPQPVTIKLATLSKNSPTFQEYLDKLLDEKKIDQDFYDSLHNLVEAIQLKNYPKIIEITGIKNISEAERDAELKGKVKSEVRSEIRATIRKAVEGKIGTNEFKMVLTEEMENLRKELGLTEKEFPSR